MSEAITLATKLITGDGCRLTVRDITKIYRDVFSHSAPISGKIQRASEGRYGLVANFQAVDCDSSRFSNFSKIYSLSTRRGTSGCQIVENVHCVSDHQDISTLATATTLNNRFTAKVKLDSTKEEKHLLEIWDRSRLIKTIDSSEVEAHGLIELSEEFRSIEWCPFGDQDKLLYVCRPKAKHHSFFKTEPKSKDSSSNNDLEPTIGTKFIHRQNFGEALKDVEHTIVAILDVADNCKVTTISMNGFSLAETQWLDDRKVISTAYNEEPRILGKLYCNNRPSRIAIHDWQESNSQPVLIGHPSESSHSPRSSNSGSEFVYLSNPLYGMHKRSNKLNLYSVDSQASRVLTDSVTGKDMHFVSNLPRICFSSNDKHILFATESDHYRSYMNLFSLESNILSAIKFPTTGISILDFRHDIILASGSEVNATPTLFVASIDPDSTQDVVAWHQLEDCIHRDELEFSAHLVKCSDGSGYDNSAILVRPNLGLVRSYRPAEIDKSCSESQIPTIVFVHGGPHAAFTLSYMAEVVFYIRLGFKVLLINFRGSTAVSEEYSGSILTRIGEQDVNDCLDVIRHFIERGAIDKERLVYIGGSHSGFIGCHLSCQKEIEFKCMSIINPVVELFSLYAASDLPDWTLCESLGDMEYNPARCISREDLLQMYEQSTMRKCEEATVPTFMALGSEDVRVPMFQGQRWVDNLKARGIKTMCKVYPAGHNIKAIPEHAADWRITTAYWFLSNLENQLSD